MITFSPMPKWKHLLRLLKNETIDEKVLSNPWCREGDEIVWTSCAAVSLKVIASWWESSF